MAEFDPATLCQRAPHTSSTEEAIERGLGGVEQEILEAIENDRVGFARGWVSSFYLDKLLRDIDAAKKIPINRRRELLKTLGYDWHPALLAFKGQVHNVVHPDNAKPRLFIRNDHPARALTTAAEVARAYTQAQNESLVAHQHQQ